MNWYFEVLKKYAVFSGRARRQEYWIFCLCNLLITMILVFIDSAAGLEISDGIGLLYMIYSLAVCIPSLAVCVRRLHDIGKSGWNLLFCLIPIIGSIIIIVWYCKDGTPGYNQWGPNPKEQ